MKDPLRFAGKFLLVTCSFAVSFVLIEAFYRASLLIAGRQRIYQSHPVLGWAPRKNVVYKKELITSLGEPYIAEYSTNSLGMRYFQGSSNPKNQIQHNLKVLVLGDSCTGDLTSSDQSSWFSVLHRETPGADFYVYGIGGSGTYQQYLAFKDISKSMEFDVLIIQHASNDPLNDSYASSFDSYTWNQDLRRPYFVEGKTVYRDDLSSKIYKFVYNNSYLYQRLDVNVQAHMYQSRLAKNTIPVASIEDILNWKRNYTFLVNSARSSGVTKVASVSCSLKSEDPAAYQAWLEASNDLGVSTFESMAEIVKLRASMGDDVYFQDGGHFNNLGGLIAGEMLAEEMHDSGFWLD